MTGSGRCRVRFDPLGAEASQAGGESLLEFAREAGVWLPATCSGRGTCRSCRVQAEPGEALLPPDALERAGLTEAELAAGYRLACRARAVASARVVLPATVSGVSQRLQLEGLAPEAAVAPVLRRLELVLPPARDGRAGTVEDRLTAALAAVGAAATVSAAALSELVAGAQRQGGAVGAVLWRDRVVRLTDPGQPGAGLALAIDLGTTKIAAFALEAASGEVLASAGMANPQSVFGGDVVSRLEYALRGAEQARRLRRTVLRALNQLADQVARAAGASAREVLEVCLVANSAMHHLLLGLPVSPLATAPYAPVLRRALEVPASEIGLELWPAAHAYLPPLIGGQVGSDHVAALLAANVLAGDATRLVVDIGTNTEIGLATRDGRLLVTSAPSGPAFEGGHLGAGMSAADGAIERVRLGDGGRQVDCTVIGGVAPVGVCGSGIIDAIAQMHAEGVVDALGRLVAGSPRVVEGTDRAARAFVLAWEEESGNGRRVEVAQRDIQAAQLAKAAIRTGIDLLLAEARVPIEQIEEVLVAGAFGSYLEPASAVSIGMFPEVPVDRFRVLGNAAGAGARLCAVCEKQRWLSEDLAERAELVEQGGHPRFTATFARALRLPGLLASTAGSRSVAEVGETGLSPAPGRGTDAPLSGTERSWG